MQCYTHRANVCNKDREDMLYAHKYPPTRAPFTPQQQTSWPDMKRFLIRVLGRSQYCSNLFGVWAKPLDG